MAAGRQGVGERVLVVGLLAMLLVGCFQPWRENTVMLVNRSGIDLEVRTESGHPERKEFLHWGPTRGYPLPPGQRCLDDTLLFFDEEGVLRATLVEPCGGDHAIRPEDLDPAPDGG